VFGVVLEVLGVEGRHPLAIDQAEPSTPNLERQIKSDLTPQNRHASLRVADVERMNPQRNSAHSRS
jgi:hypothetical protein